MHKIASYKGNLLAHIEAVYRPGERDIAIKIVEALGCATSDTGFMGDGDESFLAVHPNPDDQDVQNNAIYMSPMRSEQFALEQHLAKLSIADPKLRAMLEDYRTSAKAAPFGVSHFALRYSSGAEVRSVADALERSIAPLLGDRLTVRIFEPDDTDAAASNLVQGFVYQDVIVSGSFFFGQLIELQSRTI